MKFSIVESYTKNGARQLHSLSFGKIGKPNFL